MSEQTLPGWDPTPATGFTIKEQPDHDARRRLSAWLIAVVALMSLIVSGCGGPAIAGSTTSPPTGTSVAILASATDLEPRAQLTPAATTVLLDAAKASIAPGAAPGADSSVVVGTADGTFRATLPLTPRRADGSTEHGLQQGALIDKNLNAVAEAVKDLHQTTPGLDLLNGLDRIVSGSATGTLVVISNGLATKGGLDYRTVGWNSDPEAIVAQLAQGDLLPDLHGWRVLWLGLNATAGQQPPLPKPFRDINKRYWSAICTASGAASCSFDETGLDPAPPVSTVDSPVVLVPHISSVPGSPTNLKLVIPDALLGFTGNSAALPPSSSDAIADVVSDIGKFKAKNRDLPISITVTGYTADPPGSGPADRLELSTRRGEAFADALHLAGVTEKITVVGGGTAPGLTSIRDGQFVESLAEPMRRVEAEVTVNS